MLGVRRRVISALVVAGALTVGGCAGGGPEPGPSPRPTAEPTVHAAPAPIPSPTASTSVVAKPERPMAMARTDEVGAAAAARYFLSLYPYILQSGDFAEWDAMSFETCDFCAGIRKAASEIAKNGDSFVGGEITVTNLHVLPIDEELRGYPIDLSIVQEPSTRSNSEGVVIEKGAAEDRPIRIDALYSSNRWVIVAVAKAA